MKKNIFHSGIVIITLFITFIISFSPLSAFELQIAALICILYFLYKKSLGKNYQFLFSPRIIDSIVYVFVVGSIVNSTGGINSYFFFLYYFLIFALSLLLEPDVSITITLGVLILFYTFTPQLSFSNYITLISLPIMVPFALILGGEYAKILKQKKQIEDLKCIQRRLEEKIAEEEKENKLFLSLIVKTHLKHAQKISESLPQEKASFALKKILGRTEKLISRYESE